MNVGTRQVMLVAALACAATAPGVMAQGGRESARAERQGRDAAGESYFHRHGYTRLNIPKGHYPPPGECRVWFPGRPPGQQPPPGGCNARVPRGAWLIRHPADNPDHVHAVVYDDKRPGAILAVGEFRIGSGVFVRVVVDR